MALPTLSSTQVEDIYTSTFNKKLPGAVDNVYGSNPAISLMKAQGQVILDGGKEVEQPIIYDKLNGDWYGTGDSFNTATKNTMTAFILPWRRLYVNVTIDGIEDLQNAGAAAVFSHAGQKVDQSQRTLKDKLGTGLFGSSNDSGGKAMSGLEEWLDDGTNFSTIGGITRGTDVVGTAAKATYEATAGSWTIPDLQDEYGTTTFENEKVDLIITTQTLWNALMMRVQPQQRYPIQGTQSAKLAAIGFDALQYQRAGVVVDSHVQSGRVYGVTMKYAKLFVHKKRPGDKIRGWMPTSNKDERVTQVLWAGNLVIGAPRQNFQQRGRTA